MRIKSLWLLPAIGLLIAGCGGSGGGTSAAGGGNGGGGGLGTSSEMTPVFATDAPAPNWQNVWVTIYGVNLVSSTGTTVSAFKSTAGLTVDVRHLRDSVGQLFELLNAQGVPAGSYTSAQVLLSNTVTIVKAGSTTSTTYQFSTANSGGTGDTLLSVAFKQSFTANGTSPIVLDFDLDNWSINTSNQVVASLGVVFAADVNTNGRQVDRPIQGVIENLTGAAGTQTFDLVHDGNAVLQVATSTNTTIANANGAANPSLANAEHVFLTGTFTSDVFTADNIIIENANAVPVGTVHVQGAFSNVNATAGTFTLTEETCDAALSSTALTVDTTSSTVYSADGITETEAQFFAQLAQYPNANVMATGTVSGSTLTATDLSINIPASQGGGTHLIAASGLTSDVSATAGTFTLTIKGWQGLGARKGETLSVVTNTATYYNLNGAASTEAAWFADVTATTPVIVVGTVTNGTVTADALVIGTQANALGMGGGGGNGGH